MRNYAVETLQAAFKEGKRLLNKAQTEKAAAEEALRRNDNYVIEYEKRVAELGLALEALGAPRE